MSEETVPPSVITDEDRALVAKVLADAHLPRAMLGEATARLERHLLAAIVIARNVYGAVQERERIVAVIRGLGRPHGGYYVRHGDDKFKRALASPCPTCKAQPGSWCRVHDEGESYCVERMPLGPEQWLHEFADATFVEDVIGAITAGQEGA